ncbi:NADPH-dependent FMN reductase [Sphingomonas morindae]|uniref:NAD(P)H-dependent oxidoreductase n=1 Tax=Sphingomonas morindae TaxID=1541170 RepID=A0ABY4X7D5_9SPHN|nr:NADPH-dependent FMN reductase [Sphingomonas morindae]USI72848.1 NAD(P)H-dependent oxidoreductase [Sphingomonas morindae]
MRRLLILYGSYRSERAGIRLAEYLVRRFRERGVDAELIDAKCVRLPMLDRMYKEYEPGTAPPAMEELAGKIVGSDAFLFVAGEYNWGVQPGLKNLTDHFLEKWFWRPAALATYSAGRFAGARAGYGWHPTLAELGMVVIPSALAVGPIGSTLDNEGVPRGDGGSALEHNFNRFADELAWWADAALRQRELVAPPY